jgi:hypothetical protein
MAYRRHFHDLEGIAMEASILILWLFVVLQVLLLAGCGGGGAGSADRSEVPATLAPSVQPRAGTGTVKWNPGHYVAFDTEAEDSEVHAGLDEIQNLPFVKGIVLRAFWRQLEPQKDVYDFSRIDRYLELAAAHKKRFGLLLTTKNFRAGVAAPDYLRTPWFEGGIFEVTSFKGVIGDNITLWNINTYYRLVRLVKALAARYDGNPWFEVLIINETAFSYPVIPVTEAQRIGFYDNLIRLDNVARQVFARTVVIQYVNFPPRHARRVAQNLLDKGIGIGGPDVFLDDEDHEKLVYPLIEPASGRVPVGMQVESDCYYARTLGGPWNPPPARELYDFARNRLHSNYIIWHRVLETVYRPWEKVLSMFRSPDFPANASGGLETACPASYARCVGQRP